MYSLPLRFYGLILVASSATPYLNFSPNQNCSFSLRNLTTLESSLEIDPHFTGLVEDTGEDLFRQIHLYERRQDTG